MVKDYQQQQIMYLSYKKSFVKSDLRNDIRMLGGRMAGHGSMC